MRSSIIIISEEPGLEQRTDLARAMSLDMLLMHDGASVQTAKRCLMSSCLFDHWGSSGFRLSLDTGSTAMPDIHCIAQRFQDELSIVAAKGSA